MTAFRRMTIRIAIASIVSPIAKATAGGRDQQEHDQAPELGGEDRQRRTARRLGQGVGPVLPEPPGGLGLRQPAPGVGAEPGGDLGDGERVPGLPVRRGRRRLID